MCILDRDLREYRTGQGVPLSGSYMCQSGATAKLSKNEVFPQCPVSKEDTYWKHHQER